MFVDKILCRAAQTGNNFFLESCLEHCEVIPDIYKETAILFIVKTLKQIQH